MDAVAGEEDADDGGAGDVDVAAGFGDGVCDFYEAVDAGLTAACVFAEEVPRCAAFYVVRVDGLAAGGEVLD